MNMFNRISDWATNNSKNFSKENNIYEQIISEIKNLNTSLDLILDSNSNDFIEEVPEIMDLISLKSIIEFKKKSLIKVNSEKEQNDVLKEIKRLEEKYNMLLKKIKNLLLRNEYITDIQKSTFEINSLIYHNAVLEALKPFIEDNIIYKKWTLDELISLRNSIAQRRTIILPYLIKTDYNK